MSNLRKGKAINKEVFEKSQNTLILVEDNEITHYSKIEDKLEILNGRGSKESLEEIQILFVWTGATRSDVFQLDFEDVIRLLEK